MARNAAHEHFTRTQNTALVEIEQLLIELPEDSGTVPGLMREHLEEARWYLIGSMTQEYLVTLRLAKRLLADLRDQDLRERIRIFLKSQLPAGRFT